MSARDVEEQLRVSLAHAYRLLARAGAVRAGRTIRIEERTFAKWLASPLRA